METYEKGTRTVATIGTFDGVHIGHVAIIRSLVDTVRREGGESVLINFHPHPRLVLFPENNPLRLLHTLEEKIALLETLGLDKLLVIPFSREFSRLNSTQFIRDILVGAIGVNKLIIGYDHHFGKNRTGNIDELQTLSTDYGYEVEEIPAQLIDEAAVSSTKIRQALISGQVEVAHKFLGYPYSYSGTVVHGEKQGRLLGYPTANLAPLDERKLIPADGIYFVRVSVPDPIHSALASESFYGMMSIGKKPTMGEFERSHEVYIFDFNRDVYGQVLRVHFLAYLRPEEKFAGIPDLIAAMRKDEERSRELINQLANK